MNRLWMSGMAAAIAITMTTVGAQTPQYPPQTPQTQQPSTSAMQTASTTVQGCVYKEEDVPGRTPNVAEKAGMMEDYILVVSPNPSATAGTTGTTPPSASMAGAAFAAGKAFKLEKIADERLKAVVGKRVEVTGRVDDAAKAATGVEPDQNPASPDKIELPEFEVSALKEVEGTCPATPEIKK
jgi:hypothetical protein